MTEEQNLSKASRADVEAITHTVLDYIESCYEGNHERMAQAIHPALAKRTMEPHRDTGKKVLRPTSAEMLVENIRGVAETGRQTPKEEWRADVTIFDVYEDIATVKVMATFWVDYLHLVRHGDRWVILNALWRPYEW